MLMVNASMPPAIHGQAAPSSVQPASTDAQGAATAATAPGNNSASDTSLNNRASEIPFDQLQHPSLNPFDAYRGKTVPPPSLANSARLDSLVKDGKLYLTLQNAIDLALENNLDLVIARYNLPIAQMDVLRTEAGGSVRGVNTGVVSGTPGGAGGVFGTSSGAGAGGTRAAQAARAPEHRAWCSRRWARAHRSTHTIR